MRYIIVDLEATCWANSRGAGRMEIIEIGAVHLDSANGPSADEFGCFVRPKDEPKLSAFCTELTSITQSDVDGAESFPVVFGEFIEWIGPEPFVLCSWGAYDVSQFRADCLRHSIAFPASFERHINLKQEFARVFGVKSRGMKAALAHVGIELKGTHHRGIDDARNIGKLAELILPRLEEDGLLG